MKIIKLLSFAFMMLFAVSISQGSDGTQPGELAPEDSTDCQTGGLANVYCPYWDVSVTYAFESPAITCQTGGEHKCKERKSPTPA